MVAVRGQWNADFAKAMVQPAIYAWLTSIGSFLILLTDDYFIALLQDVSSIPAYRATYQFVSTLFMIVAPIPGSSAVFISQMWQSLIPRLAIWGFIVWKQPGLLAYQGKWNYENARLLIKPSLYWWLTDLGALKILRTDAYFIALLRGTEDIPSYQAAYQLVANLYILAISFRKASSVFISQAWQAGNLSTVQRLTR